MFKSRAKAKAAMLLAGVGSTHPLTMSALMSGYDPAKVRVIPVEIDATAKAASDGQA